jgi:hypothetical protein
MTNPNNKPVRAYDEFYTNISGLPEGEYMTQTMWSDQQPWKVIGRSKSGLTVTLQRVGTTRDPSWTPEIVVGGFVGHCTNNDTQRYIFAGMSPETTVVRLRKSRYIGSDKLWASPQAGEFIANGAVRFYDYNF